MSLKRARKSVLQNKPRKRKVSTASWLGLRTEAHDRRADTSELPAHARIAPIEIDDPNALSGETERIVVARSISADSLAWLHAHHQIDDARFLAGRSWQALWERAALGSVQSVDTTKEPVDGGRWPDVVTDNQALALRELRRVAKALGPELGELVEDVLGRGYFISQAANMRGAKSWRTRANWSRKFYSALDVLAVEFGLATRPALAA